MLNKIIMQGRLCADPEIRKTASGQAVASFRLASDDSRKGPNGERLTVFMNCTMWGVRAENFAKFTRKGSQVLIEGRLTQRSYVNKAGVNVTATEITADNFELLDPKGSSGATASGYVSDAAPQAPASQVQPNSGNLDSIDVVDDDLPF